MYHRHHHHHHHHFMNIVVDKPSVPPIVTTTTQLGLPTHPPHHFPTHRTTYDLSLRRSPSLLVEDYYAKNHHQTLTSYGDLDDAPAPLTARRVDKSGLLEIVETDPITRPRSCVLTRADVHAVLRMDRSGLLETVPEAVDQLEERNDNKIKIPLRDKDKDEAVEVLREEMFKICADINSRVFENNVLIERSSSLEDQTCPNEVDIETHFADFKVLSGSSRPQIDISEATERLSHLVFSPGSSLRRFRNDTSKRSPLTKRCVNVDSNRRSPELIAKCTAASSVSEKSVDLSQNPTPHVELSQIKCIKNNIDPVSIDSDISIDAVKISNKSFANITAEQKINSPGDKRIEAEGCEHAIVKSLEDKVSLTGSNKLLDNVQTLKVVILSEQL